MEKRGVVQQDEEQAKPTTKAETDKQASQQEVAKSSGDDAFSKLCDSTKK